MKSIITTAFAAVVVCFAIQSARAADEVSFGPQDPGFTYENPQEVFTDHQATEFAYHTDCGSGCNSCCEPWYAAFRSDHEFDTFMEPVTNPVFFEDPRSKTRMRAFFINQMIPEDSALGGGDFQGYHVQVTVALSERWTLLAQKDGYISLQADGLANQGGWADLATGLKYVFVRDVCNQFLFSGGLLYEWSQGSSEVFQGNGDGIWNFFLTTGKGWDRSHFIGTVGWHLPEDGGQHTESMFYSLHLDYMLNDDLYVLWELNGIYYVDAGRRTPAAFNLEGGDLINLGTIGVSGNHMVTTAFGFNWKVNCVLSIAAAYEIPLTDREDLMDNRTTINARLEY